VQLGHFYDYGHGVSQDYKEAAKWYRLAAIQGYPEGQLSVGMLYRQGRGVPEDFKQMTPDQIAEAQRLAREWKPKVSQ
jgi:uncharacterized protein